MKPTPPSLPPAMDPEQNTMKLKFLFAWYDFWVGLFWDSKKRRLYVFPVPMFGFYIQWTPTK